jgi:hypothetical protein
VLLDERDDVDPVTDLVDDLVGNQPQFLTQSRPSC